MSEIFRRLKSFSNRFWISTRLRLRTKLIMILLAVSLIPLVILSYISWDQFLALGADIVEIATGNAYSALNDIATENIEQMTTSTANMVAEFLYARDSDIMYLSTVEPSPGNYLNFMQTKHGRVVKKGEYELSDDGEAWEFLRQPTHLRRHSVSENNENNDLDAFYYRAPDTFDYEEIPLYDEITYIDLYGNELVKVVSGSSSKKNYPLSAEKKNVSIRENTYIKSETYFPELLSLNPGDIYVSDVIGAYVGTNYIGMYAPAVVQKAAADRGYDIPYAPEKQAYAGMENPNGQRFEGIVRWAAPVTRNGEITGFVTFALNHDHIMEFVDHITPMEERYIEIPSAFEGNYAFIWDYKCRSICHPRHHSIVGFDPNTGQRQIPWLEESIYDGWQASGVQNWFEYVERVPAFDNQSREKSPSPDLTRMGLVGLDGQYLNNAPQCTGWMELTRDGGSGSFYILWSGLYKLTTAAAIPYYTGQYAPSAENGNSMRGFGIVTIGAGLDYFTAPAVQMSRRMGEVVDNNTVDTFARLVAVTVVLTIFVVLIALWISAFLNGSIANLISGVSRFHLGDRRFRFKSPAKDEFGVLADAFDSMADNIVDSVSGPLCITDMDHNVIYLNDAGLEYCNKTNEEVLGKSYDYVSIYPGNTEYSPLAALKLGIASEPVYIEAQKKYVKGTASPFWGKDGEQIGYIITSTDVTEIRKAQNKAEKASRSKSEFLSNMSHEIRTPLNAIIGMTSIGRSSPDIYQKDYCLGKVSDASKHLLGVVNDILDMSKIEADKLELSPVKFCFDKMLKRVIDIINFKVEEKKQRLVLHIDPNIPFMLVCDEQRLAQVITNLLSNAVKFTPGYGLMHFYARLIEKSNDACLIEVKVTDTGVGISEKQKEHLFRPFEQAESSTSRKYGGTGLGLAISKRIIEMMGGEIWFASKMGEGSVFAFTVPVGYSGESCASLLDQSLEPGSIRVMLVSDESDMREYLTAVARMMGLNCDAVAKGEDAVYLTRENGLYDIYFVDWKTPDMDGAEFSRRLKREFAGDAHIIIVSSSNMIAAEVAASGTGVNRFVTKPLLLSELAEYVNECMGNSKNNIDDNKAGCFYGKHILLAEDVEINREIVAAMLEETSVMITFAENGLEAIRVFGELYDEIDIILMDVQMPEMDGLEATRIIRELSVPNAANVPIIALTANVFKDDVEKCIAAGMNGHAGKPIDFDELIQILHDHLEK